MSPYRRLSPLLAAFVLPVLACALAAFATAGSVRTPNQFVPGTTTDANAVNANFAAQESAINDNDNRISDLLERIDNLEGRQSEPWVRRFVLKGADEGEATLAVVGGPLDGQTVIPFVPGSTHCRIIAEIVVRASTGVGDTFRVVRYMEGGESGPTFTRPPIEDTTDDLTDVPASLEFRSVFSPVGGFTLIGKISPRTEGVVVSWTVDLRIVGDGEVGN